MRRKYFSASKYAEAIQRSTISGSRQRHILPVNSAYRSVGILNDVGGAQAAHERRSEPEAIDREGLLQAFHQTGRRIRILLLQPLSLLLEFGDAFFLRKFVSRVHHTLNLRARGLGQALGDIAHFVSTAVL